MLGEFDFSDEKLRDTTGVLPPKKSRPKIIPKIGGRKIDDIYTVSIGYRKSYGGFHSTRLIAKYRLYIALRLAALDNIFARQKGLPPGHAISSS